ncbi:MAG: hypothetical protein ABFD83_13305 [Armatimonadota bacterium]
MNRKTAVIALLAVFMLSCASFAQKGKSGPYGRAGGQKVNMGRIAKQLDLTKDQVKSIAGIVKEFHADAGDVRKSNVNQEEKQSKIKALRQSAGKSIMNVLNSDQQVKAKKMKLIDRLLNRRPASPLLGILAKLDLTQEQKASIKSVVKASDEKIKAIRQDTTLTPEVRQAKCKEVREDTISRIKEQLTLDQLKKFNELLQNRQMGKQK